MEKLSICLACNLGASTSILVEKMKEVVAGSQKLSRVDVAIEAIPAGNITAEIVKDYQIVLLGPQIGHRLAEIQEKVSAVGIPVDVIKASDYGTMNAANILKQAIYLIQTKK
ncbi:TPA: PTS sugar transporter subunit IIB [Streptococcus suis]|nr:PTS sugar transporter subunit IIB [Streptococcus suis]